MSKKNIIAPYSVIDTAFKYNPHSVEVSYYLDNPFIMHIEIGTPLLFLRASGNYVWNAPAIVKATESGFFIPALSQRSLKLSRKQLKKCILGWVFNELIDAVDYLIGCPTIMDVNVDPFTKTKSLELKWDGLLQCDGFFQLGDNLFIKLGYVDDICTITFQTNANVSFDGVNCPVYAKPPYVLSTYDTISILFIDDSILEFKSTSKSSFCCVLHQEDFDALSSKTIVATRITFGKGDKDPISMEFGNVFFCGYSALALFLYARKFMDTVIDFYPHNSLPNRTSNEITNHTDREYCFVYLMQDITNGYYKIGISNNPEYRERTLQSEKPSIEMIACKSFPTRKIAMAIESALHTAYSQQRLRGEWFNLNDADVAAIIETLK